MAYNEWEIKNFSCWNIDIHGESFTYDTPLSIPYRLYPRGVHGEGEHIEVSLPWYSAELSFIGSDGSLICERRPDFRKFTGPKFDQVVAEIRGKEPLHQDRLVLRWKWKGLARSGKLSTVIPASTVLFQIKSKMFDSNDWKQISDISFTTIDEKERHLCVSARKTDSETEVSNVELKFDSNYEEKISVQTSIWVPEGDKFIQKHENDSMIAEGYDQNSFEVPLKDLRGIQNVLCFKIITGHPIRVSSYRVDFSVSPKCSEIKESLLANAVSVLTKDFMGLYQDHDFSDLELRCGTVSFPTHKNILSARSPVFKAMLSGDMREAACGHVDVDDLDPHTLGRFLSFLYSGATGEEALQWEEASRLYYAADKYQVPSLKEVCAVVLHDSVALENVCDILSLADRHQDEKIVSAAYKFIVENYHELLGSEKWDRFVLSDPLLAAKTVTNIARIKNVKMSYSN